MHASSTLFHFLSQFLTSLSKRDLATVLPMVEAIWEGEDLTLTGIGRHLQGRALVKHKIKQVCRLLSNPTFHKRFPELFAAIARMLVLPGSRPVLLVDWTCFDECVYALVASLVHDGRALPLYVEAHPIDKYATPDVEHAFLDTLCQTVLPTGVRPVVVSDAGFRNPWFAHVRSLGWDFVGRLCGRVLLQPLDATADIWVQRDVLMSQAGSTGLDLGQYRVAKTNPLTARVVTVHYRTPRTPGQKRTLPQKGPKADKYRQQAEEPWLLFTSLSDEEMTAAGVVAVYARRMQIEETFRDDKNRDTGVGLDASASEIPNHLCMLRWLGALSQILTHVVGVVGETLGLHKHYQSNTAKRRVLSLPFLGRQILRHEDRRRLTMKRLLTALTQIQNQADLAHIQRLTLNQTNISRIAA